MQLVGTVGKVRVFVDGRNLIVEGFDGQEANPIRLVIQRADILDMLRALFNGYISIREKPPGGA